MSHLLEKYAPRAPSLSAVWWPTIAIVVAIGISFSVAHSWRMIVLPLALVAVAVASSFKEKTVARLEQSVIRSEELTLCRHWDRAYKMTLDLLPSLATRPTLHLRTVLVAATCLDQLQAYDAAIVTYDYLIDQLPNSDTTSIRLRIRRAIAQLANGQLADADVALCRLRSQNDGDGLMSAGYRLACLIQQVRTNHWSDAVEQNALDLIDRLRPLGVDAGYGYALMALSCFRIQEDQPHTPPPHRDALVWWTRATRLLPVSALVNRFSELTTIASLLPMQQALPPATVR